MNRWMAANWCSGQEFENFDVRLVKEGDAWQAVVGVNEGFGVTGSGLTPIDALLDLAANLLDASGIADDLSAPTVKAEREDDALDHSEDVALRCGSCGAEVG